MFLMTTQEFIETRSLTMFHLNHKGTDGLDKHPIIVMVTYRLPICVTVFTITRITLKLNNCTQMIYTNEVTHI